MMSIKYKSKPDKNGVYKAIIVNDDKKTIDYGFKHSDFTITIKRVIE